MGVGSSVPVQMLQGLSKSRLFGEGQASFDGGMAGERLAVFAPFTGTRRDSEAGESEVRRIVICC